MPQCPLCGSADSRYRFSERGYRVLQCRGCDLLYISPYPQSEEDVHRAARSYDHLHARMISAADHYENSKRTYDAFFPKLAYLFDGARTYLDAGCGTGYLLALAGNRNPDLIRVGVELNRERAAFARKAARCEVFEIPIETFTYERPFDVITFIDVLSHVPSFDDTFAAFRRLLSPGGRLVIKAGEVVGRPAKWLAPDWYIPEHLHFLGRRTMEFVAAKYGFAIEGRMAEPFSDAIFARERWLSRGSSRTRDLVKKMIAHTPAALSIMKKAYRMLVGEGMVVSIFVLRKVDEKPSP